MKEKEKQRLAKVRRDVSDVDDLVTFLLYNEDKDYLSNLTTTELKEKLKQIRKSIHKLAQDAWMVDY